MSYVRLLRLPPQSEVSGFTRSWKRHLSACSTGKNVRHAWADLHAVNPLQYRRSRPGGSCALGSDGGAIAPGAIGSRCIENEGIARGDLCMGSIAATRERSAALAELPRLESSPSHRALLLCSNTLGPSLRSQGSLVSGYGSRAGRATPQQQMHWQSLRGLSSAPPEQPDAKTDAPDSNGRRALPGQKVFMGGLLKPSDVSLVGWFGQVSGVSECNDVVMLMDCLRVFARITLCACATTLGVPLDGIVLLSPLALINIQQQP